MKINAVVDRIENGYAILRSDDFGMEICIPSETSDKKYKKGENVSLLIESEYPDENVG